MKDYLCKCNNCDSVLIDMNPQFDAEEKEVPKNAKEMVKLGSPLGYIVSEQDAMRQSKTYKVDPALFWACPECNTDEYLTDNIDTMNYKRTQSKNARLKSENWIWVKIVLWTTFCLSLSLFGPEILKLIK